MSEIQGNAKKYDGSSIDYVLIFDWSTGACLGVSNPDQSGLWNFYYGNDMVVGITYVATGCEPITHGPYEFFATNDGLFPSGFLLLSYSTPTSDYTQAFDASATDYKNWEQNFSHVLDIGLLDYSYGSGVQQTPWRQKIINDFQLWWNLRFSSVPSPTSDSYQKSQFEILDTENNVLFAIEHKTDGGYSSGLWYGDNLNTLIKAPQSGLPSTNGILSFTQTLVTFNNVRPSNYNGSFTHGVDLSNAARVRVGGESYVSGGTSREGSFILLLPKSPDQ